jgi:hypothetical protein
MKKATSASTVRRPTTTAIGSLSTRAALHFPSYSNVSRSIVSSEQQVDADVDNHTSKNHP